MRQPTSVLNHHLRHLGGVPITELDDAANFLAIEYFPFLALDLSSPDRYMEFDLHPQDPDKLICLMVVNNSEMIQTSASLTLGYFVIKASGRCHWLLQACWKPSAPFVTSPAPCLYHLLHPAFLFPL